MNSESRRDSASAFTTQADDPQKCKYMFTPPVGYHKSRSIRRQILPRRPTRDLPLVQDCSFYRSNGGGADEKTGLLVMLPHSDRPEDIPYYHPVLRKLAFRYSSAVPSVEAVAADVEASTSATEQPEILGTISISILPFLEESATQSTKPIDRSTSRSIVSGTEAPGQGLSSDVLPNRTYRTCLHLLETLHKHGWGRVTGYQKRVVHDVRSEFPQELRYDIYMVSKHSAAVLISKFKCQPKCRMFLMMAFTHRSLSRKRLSKTCT